MTTTEPSLEMLGGQHLLLGEYGNGGSQGAGRSEYLWLPRPGGEAELIGVYQGGRVYSAHTDMLGTPRQLKDDKGQLVWQWAYSAYGDNKPMGLLRSTSKPGQAYASSTATRWLRATPAPVQLNLRYAGQYFDAESNLSYNYFRSYQPSQGRYTQSDPIGLGGGINTYQYVGGNPLSYTDPLGLNPVGGAYAGAGIGSVFGPVGTVVGGVIGAGVGAWIGWNVIGPMLQSDGSSRPPGAIDAIPGSKEWGRKNGVKNPVDIFHGIKQGNRSKPGSKAADNCSVDPNTGDVYDGQGEHIGNLGEGH
jgi:RHS repeat-associated protein